MLWFVIPCPLLQTCRDVRLSARATGTGGILEESYAVNNICDFIPRGTKLVELEFFRAP